MPFIPPRFPSRVHSSSLSPCNSPAIPRVRSGLPRWTWGCEIVTLFEDASELYDMKAFHSSGLQHPARWSLEDEGLWRDFPDLLAQACGAEAAAVVWVEGYRIRLGHATGMPPSDLVFGTREEAAELLEIPGAFERMLVRHSGWTSVATESFRDSHGRVLGAVCIFSGSLRLFSHRLLTGFARHAEALVSTSKKYAKRAPFGSKPCRGSEHAGDCAQDSLRKARDAAEAASAAKDEFIAKLSHELRTPLTPALMAIGMLLDRHDLDAQVREDLALIHRNVELEARLIDDLLDVTRIIHGKLDLQLEDVDLHRVIQHAGAICGGFSRERRVGLCFSLEAGDRFIQGDPARIEQVFWNLFHNAIKFSDSGSPIEVRTANPIPGQILIEVQDFGVGIPPEKISGLFGAFEQGGAGVTKKFGGLGLGLAICQGIIDLHEGDLSASSPGVGCGATFSVRLNTVTPKTRRFPDLRHDAYHAPGAQDEFAHRNARVLLVEDHQHAAEILARLLRRAGYRVEIAHCLAEARELIERLEFDLLISDIGLPDGTGLDLMAFVRERSLLPGIALSGYGTEEDVAASLAAGFSEHVIKPVEWKRLDAVIRNVRQRHGRAAEARLVSSMI